MTIKPYLQLCRTHTSPLETVPAIIGASLAVGGMINPGVALWGLFGFLYHNTGYGMNSYFDWVKGYDKDDPHKQHFPLNTGELNSNKARVLVYTLIVVSFLYGVILTWNSLWAFGILLSGAIAGIIYNTIGKEIHWKSLFIAYAHSTTFAAPYIALNGAINDVFIVGWAFVFMWVIYQIQIEGDVKDMITDEENFLINMGSIYNNNSVYFPIHIKILAHAQKLAAAVLIFGLARMLGATLIVQIAAPAVVILSSAIFGTQLLANGNYNRTFRIKTMARIELSSMLAMLIAIVPVIEVGWSFGIFMISLAWVMAFNQIQWGTMLAPDV